MAQTDHWDDSIPDSLPERQIRINLNPQALLASSQTLAINADVAVTLEQVLPLIQQADASRHDQAQHRIAVVNDQLPGSMTAVEEKHKQVLDVVMPALPDNTIVVSDMTQLAYTAIDFIPLEQPNSWFHPTGYGTLGYALPAAMGAAMARPAQPVLVIVGDAGLQYTMGELTLLGEMNLNVVILLWNNDALKQIRDDMVNADIDPLAVTQKNPDFIKLADACSCASTLVNTIDELSEQLKLGFSHTQRPLLIQLNENELT